MYGFYWANIEQPNMHPSPYVHIATEFNNVSDWARVKVQTSLLQFLMDFCRTNPQLFMVQQRERRHVAALVVLITRPTKFCVVVCCV